MRQQQALHRGTIPLQQAVLLLLGIAVEQMQVVLLTWPTASHLSRATAQWVHSSLMDQQMARLCLPECARGG